MAFALASLCAALGAALGMGLEGQIIGFSVVSLLFFFFGSDCFKVLFHNLWPLRNILAEFYFPSEFFQFSIDRSDFIFCRLKLTIINICSYLFLSSLTSTACLSIIWPLCSILPHEDLSFLLNKPLKKAMRKEEKKNI